MEPKPPPKLVDVATGDGRDRSQAWGCVLGNLMLPGLGTFAARRRVSGVLQLLVSQIGFLLSLLWAILYVHEWLKQSEMPADLGPHFQLGLLGVALFLLAWIWSLASSVDILSRSRKSGL